MGMPSSTIFAASKKGLSTSAHSDQSSQSGAVSSSIHGNQPIHDTQIDTSQSDDDCATESSMWSDIVDTVTSTFSKFACKEAQVAMPSHIQCNNALLRFIL